MADVSITAANVLLVSGGTATAYAGAAVTAGQAIRKHTDKKMYPSDCETSQATSAVDGIALNSAGIGQPVTYVKNGGVVAAGGTLVAGGRYVLSAAGKIAPYADLAANDWITDVGVALTTANLKLDVNATGIQHA